MTKFVKVPLGEVILINPDSVKHDYQFKEIEYVDISAIDSNTLSSTTRYSLGKAPSRAKRLVKDGDTILATVRPNLRSYLLIKQPKSNLVVSTGFAVLRATSKINHRFLYYIVADQNFTDYLTASAKGSAYPAVDNDIIKRAEILLPPLPTQHKIASILSAYDDLIENNTRRIKILEEMAQMLYREWFVNFRFPDHENVKMVESELGLIPEGWEVKKLGDIASVNSLSLKATNAPDEINYIDISSVSTGQIDKVETIDFANAPSRARRIVKHGDIIWATVRPNRKSYSLILNPSDNLIVSTGFAVITAKKAPYTYLYKALTTDNFVDYLTNSATGSAYPAVNSSDFKNADVMMPDKFLLDKYHNIVVEMLQQKQNLQNKNINLRKTRDLLLPKLISGEIDVENLDIETVAAAA